MLSKQLHYSISGKQSYISYRSLILLKKRWDGCEFIKWILNLILCGLWPGLNELKERIKESQNRLNYLLDVHLFITEDIHLNSTVLTWPQEILPIFLSNDEVRLRRALFSREAK